MRKLILVFATLIWLGFWWWWYTCKICTTCACATAEKAIPFIPQESGVLLFNLNDSITLLQSGWPKYRDSLAQSMLPNQTIEIEGQYLNEEPNISSFENIGMARAHAIKRLFPDSLQKSINLSSLLINKRETMQYPFVASTIAIKTRSEKIEQTGEKTLIYFKSNSDQRINDAEIEKYLSELSAQHQDSQSAFEITGHTDNVGDEALNKALGLNRANTIKKYLVSKGIAADRIITKSLGEASPIADNASKEGRQKNRRIEIELIQKQ